MSYQHQANYEVRDEYIIVSIPNANSPVIHNTYISVFRLWYLDRLYILANIFHDESHWLILSMKKEISRAVLQLVVVLRAQHGFFHFWMQKVKTLVTL